MSNHLQGTKPTLSVAVLTYKHEQYISQTLDGILSQQVNFDYEVVIADDCSPDGTRDVIERYRQKYPDKIRTLYPEHNLGMWQNVLRLLNGLEGKYYAFLEGDDYWIDDHKLQKQYDFLEANPEYVCCFHNAKVIREKDTNNELMFTRYPARPVPQTTGLFDLLMEGNYVPSSSMMQRNVFKGHFPEVIADTKVWCDTMLQFLQAGHGKYYYMDEDMSVYRLHGGGVTETVDKVRRLTANIYMIERSDEFTKGKWHKEHQRALQKWYYWMLGIYRIEGNKPEIKKYLSLILENKAFDPDYHPNFARKVWLEEFFPGGKKLMKLLGK